MALEGVLFRETRREVDIQHEKQSEREKENEIVRETDHSHRESSEKES